jgi:UDP-glucose 4-epimerase
MQPSDQNNIGCKMKAIVTGGCGFIGSHLVDLLLEMNISTLVLDNFSSGRPENLAHHSNNEKLTVIELDISKNALSMHQYFEDADFVFHLAALADIVPSIKDPDAYFQSNVIGTMNVIQAARNAKSLKKFVYAASASCYGVPDEFPTKEDADIRVEYPYALTKRLAEEMVLHWGKVYDLPVNSTRFFNAYGPRSRTSGTYGAVFGVFLAQKLANKAFTVVGTGEQTRDFTYISDIVSGIWAVAQMKQCNEVLNIGSGGTYSINQLVALIGGEINYIPKRPGEPDCTFADISKIKKLTDWQPKISFEQGVNKMLGHIDYWKNAPVWDESSIAIETKEWFEALSEK